MTEKTKDYDLFKFREDNRQKIDNEHVKVLTQSIKSRNLLDMKPIIVNEDMEIMDGQHRLLAAKALGVDIYYKVEKKIKPEDIILLNISKSWGTVDYLNYYCKHDYIEYKKLKSFIEKNKLSLRLGVSITFGNTHTKLQEFKQGKYIFTADVLQTEIDMCWETIEYIKKYNGFSSYVNSSKFWKALFCLVKHPKFDENRWRANLQKMVSHFRPQARTCDYSAICQQVYNWHTTNKINLIDADE